jgi:hypothetical protein
MSMEDRFLLERLGKEHGWKLRFINSAREPFSMADHDLIRCA